MTEVHVLHIGDTTVPFGQFYGGLDGQWLGWRAVAKFLNDKSHYIQVPIFAFLIEHPGHGRVLVDTGINWDQAHHHRDYYDGPLLRMAFDEDEYQLQPGQQLRERLGALGLTPADIDVVVLTHLHEDHLGGVRELLGSRILVSRANWRARNLGIFPFRRTPALKGVLTDPELIDFTSGPYASFDSSQDIFGDGSVVLLPTPGHAPGHLSVLVNAGPWQLLCVGDTMYTVRHLASDQIRPIMLGQRAQQQQLDSITRIQQLIEHFPDLILAPGHDHTEYGALLERTVQGTPAEGDLKALCARMRHIFAQPGRLREPSLPTYHPSAPGSTFGRVEFQPRPANDGDGSGRPNVPMVPK